MTVILAGKRMSLGPIAGLVNRLTVVALVVHKLSIEWIGSKGQIRPPKVQREW